MENNKKKNLKLYPKYRQLSMDFLFYYTINVLFLTQVKKIDMSSVVLVDTFYSIFVILWQIPVTILVGKIGRKKGMVLGNIFNVLYLTLVMTSTSLLGLICAELASALGFSLKEISEPAILNESIDHSHKERSIIFAKVQGKAVSGYYALSAISLILSGFLYEINGYIPISLSLCIVIITLLLSTRFKEIENPVDEDEYDEVSLKEAVTFAIESKRCRCLLMFSGIFYAIICVLATYEINLLESMEIPSRYIGIIFAVLNIISSMASRRQHIFQDKFKNRTLTVLGLSLALSCIISAFVAYLNINIFVKIIIILAMYMVKYTMVGLYNVLLIKYLSNFTNNKIDTKIFAVNSFNSAILSVVFGLIGSGLLTVMSIEYSMIAFGIISISIISIVLVYMKKRVGLDPKQYSELELKYDKMK